MNSTIHTMQGEIDKQQKAKIEWEIWYQDMFGIVKQATRDEDLLGIDYWGNDKSIQLKCDLKSDDTGNYFMEEKIIDNNGEHPGWDKKLLADEYHFYSPKRKRVVILSKNKLEIALLDWRDRYLMLGPVNNIDTRSGRTWRAWGMAVPIGVVSQYGKAYLIMQPELF